MKRFSQNISVWISSTLCLNLYFCLTFSKKMLKQKPAKSRLSRLQCSASASTMSRKFLKEAAYKYTVVFQNKKRSCATSGTGALPGVGQTQGVSFVQFSCAASTEFFVT
jgi:hypothetical protein